MISYIIFEIVYNLAYFLYIYIFFLQCYVKFLANSCKVSNISNDRINLKAIKQSECLSSLYYL